MTSPKASPLLRRYVVARQQLADLDAQPDYLAGLSRDALNRFDQTSDSDRQQAGLEHDALRRAATLFSDKHDQPIKSRLQATMQTTRAALETSGTDPEKEARRLDRIRASRPRKASLAEIRDRLRKALDRAQANEARRRLEAQADDELEATPEEKTPPAPLPDAPAVALSHLETMGSGTSSAPYDDLERRFVELSERLAVTMRRPARGRAQAPRWFRLPRLFRL